MSYLLKNFYPLFLLLWFGCQTTTESTNQLAGKWWCVNQVWPEDPISFRFNSSYIGLFESISGQKHSFNYSLIGDSLLHLNYGSITETYTLTKLDTNLIRLVRRSNYDTLILYNNNFFSNPFSQADIDDFSFRKNVELTLEKENRYNSKITELSRIALMGNQYGEVNTLLSNNQRASHDITWKLIHEKGVPIVLFLNIDVNIPVFIVPENGNRVNVKYYHQGLKKMIENSYRLTTLKPEMPSWEGRWLNINNRKEYLQFSNDSVFYINHSTIELKAKWKAVTTKKLLLRSAQWGINGKLVLEVLNYDNTGKNQESVEIYIGEELLTFQRHY